MVADTDSWEQKLAQVLEEMPEVVRYVKNHGLGFTIPYTLNGDERQYTPVKPVVCGFHVCRSPVRRFVKLARYRAHPAG